MNHPNQQGDDQRRIPRRAGGVGGGSDRRDNRRRPERHGDREFRRDHTTGSAPASKAARGLALTLSALPSPGSPRPKASRSSPSMSRSRRARAPTRRPPPAARRRPGWRPPQREGLPDRRRQARPALARRPLYAALAEKERAVISQRTKAALAAAKARGQALGNPRLPEARAIANAAHKAEADAHSAMVAPAIREAQGAGAQSLRQIAGAVLERARDRHGARGQMGSDDGSECPQADRGLASAFRPSGSAFVEVELPAVRW